MATTNTTNSPKRCTLIGHLGHDPERRTIPAKQEIKTVYDPVADGPVDKVIDLPERNFLTYSVACNIDRDTPARWINCVDWEGEAWRARQGDKVELTGYFEQRSYTNKQGERKTVRQFVVQSYRMLRMKTRETE